VKNIIVAGLVLLSVARPVSAQVVDTTTLGTVVVTATKSPAEKASLTQAVTIIRGDDIRQQGIARVSDALRTVPGVAIAQNGSIGSVNTLFLRGGESRYTKVLIDGVAVNAPGGFFDFSHLSTDNIDRIEIVRGASSVVHGADAMSGVIQIFTRQGSGPLAFRADVRAGTNATREASVESAGAAGRARFSLGASADRTDGIYSFNNNYYNGTLSGSAGYSPVNGSDVVVSARYGASEFHYPTDFSGAPVDSNAYRVQHRLTVGVDARTRISDLLIARGRAGTNEVSDLTEDIGTPFLSNEQRVSSSLSRNKRRKAEIGVTAELPLQSSLSAGLEYEWERERSVNEDAPIGGDATPLSSFGATRNTRSAYGELTGSIRDRASYTVSARLDDNSDYGTHSTYRAGTNIPVTSTTRLRASFSTAFNAPAFNQLRPTLFTKGSPDLAPERGKSWEIGVEQLLLRGTVSLSGSLFRQRFTDMIQYVGGGAPDFLGSFENLTEAKSNGYEVEAVVRPASGVVASGSYTVAEPRVSRVSPYYSGGVKPGDALVRRPTHSGSASVSFTRATFGSIAVSGSYVGKRPDFDFTQFPSPVVTLPSYVRVDASGSKDVLRFNAGRSSLALTARVENVFDKEYQDVFNFSTTGRIILLGARYSGSL